MNMKHFSLIFLLLLMVAGNGFAACQRKTSGIFGQNQEAIAVSSISLPANLLVESRDYSAGELVYSSGWKSGGTVDITNCGKNYVVGWFYLNTPQSSMVSGGTIATTNISGLGVRVTTQYQAGPYDYAIVVDNNWRNGDKGADHTLNGSQYLVELVALGGPISSGTLSFGTPLAQVEFRESSSHSASGDIASQVSLTSTNVIIKAMGCSANTAGISFPFGTLNLNQFSGATKVAGAPDQAVTLTCEPGTNVTLSVSATEATGDNANHTVMALTGSGSEGVATGIGVQLGLKSSSYNSGSNGLPLNQAIAIISSQRATTDTAGTRLVSGGSSAQETLTFSAVYYKTAATVTAGTANASATLNMTYN